MSKYKNKKVVYQGKKFDSIKERNRYIVLQSWEKAGVISDLRLQVSFVLAPSVKFAGDEKAKPALRYIADFTYVKDGQLIVEDVKSKVTKKVGLYRVKKHLMKSVHGLEISEV